MKKLIFPVLLLSAGMLAGSVFAKKQPAGYILEHEKEIAGPEPGPHNGGGKSTAHRFFKDAIDSKLVFTK